MMIKTLVCLIVGALAVQANGIIDFEHLLPWPMSAQDQHLEFDATKDVVSKYIPLESAYLVGKHGEKGLYLHSSGAISFRNDSVPQNSAGICGPQNVTFRGIAPFLALTRFNQDSRVTYRETNDKTLLQKAEMEIVTSYPIFEGLKLERIFIATWLNLRPSENYACQNSFQTVLATDGTFTFAIVNYIAMQWPGERLCTDSPAAVRVGYDNREHGHGHRHEIPLSCQPNVTLVRTSSNVNVPGKYIYRLDNAGLNYLSWAYHYIRDVWSIWMWSGLFLAFAFGMLVSLCCAACCSCCLGGSKKKQARRRYRRTAHDGDCHINTINPPAYNPEDFLPPKY